MPIFNPDRSGFQTLLDIDFSTLDDQTLVAGPNTIGGRTFSYVNSAGSVAAPAIVHDLGLVIQPNPSTTYDFAAGPVTAPAVRIAMADIDPRINLTTPLRVWAYRSSNPTGSGKYMAFGPEKPGGSAQSMYADFNGNGATLNELGYLVSSNTVGAQAAGTVLTDVSMTYLPNGLGGLQTVNYIGTYANGFPDLLSITGFCKGTAVVGSAPFGSVGRVTDWDVFLTALLILGTGTFAPAWGGLRVDALLFH